MQLSELIRRYLLYGLSGPIIVLNLWVLSQVFQYFEGLITFLILSIILALILDYLVRLFERFRLNRTQAVLLVLFLFLVTLVILGFTLLPIVIGQATQLLQGLPALLEAGNRNINWLQSFINQHKLPFDLDQITNQVNNQVQAGIAELPELAINTVGQIFATILLIVLAFYMLLYGERCWKGLTNLLPSKLGNALSTSLKQQFHQFFLSQLLLALVMVLFLIPTFLILQIKFALLFVLIIGLLEVVPLFGATVGIGLVTLLVFGLQGFLPAVQVVVASVVFQQITDNIIAPRLRGDFTGLNPIWIIIALLIGGRVAGFIGVVLAMPIAATIKSTIETMRMSEDYPRVSNSDA
ncbi:MAG: AI-2E family transporter [Leptolyngbya sp. IPPAS B-1204]|uniref:AI-2E family transporter n=1 Tax=Leptolyngbya sp. NK1-12 TaxID=2547451 RepID=A0AA96WGI6_9CYAN|nr:AI-2E family transporter [Leptolyngbya sp. NK1-12]MBF2049662.1 AI-2E family transporter [Elainella sp. C42_A2020_010]WNZ24654.1 AI-2E family transporter [Leptolyngbya sp. NK1-12]